jgi:hypothetical protein
VRGLGAIGVHRLAQGIERVAARALPVLASFFVACAPGDVDEDGPCEDGTRRCASLRDYEECVDGTWSEPLDCPPEEAPSGLSIETICDEGACHP